MSLRTILILRLLFWLSLLAAVAMCSSCATITADNEYLSIETCAYWER